MNFSVLILVGSVFVASVSQILLKKSSLKKYSSVILEYLNPYVILGYGLLVVSMFLTILAYRGLEYKNGPVVEALGYIFVLAFSRVIFAEQISKRKLMGVLCILCGILAFYLC